MITTMPTSVMLAKSKSVSTSFDERIVPETTEKGIVAVHMKRYVFIQDLCRGKRVLDVACGTGYGVHHLGRFADEIVGIDQSWEAIAYACEHYRRENAAFYVMDAHALAFPDGSFDIVSSFETIEHLANVESYLSEVVRVLKPDSVYFVSTPCAQRTTRRPENPFHHQEWSPCDFRSLLDRYFGSVRLFGEKRRQTIWHRLLQKADVWNLRKKIHLPVLANTLGSMIGTVPFSEMTLEDLQIVEDNFDRALWIVAECTQPKKGIDIRP